MGLSRNEYQIIIINGIIKNIITPIRLGSIVATAKGVLVSVSRDGFLPFPFFVPTVDFPSACITAALPCADTLAADFSETDFFGTDVSVSGIDLSQSKVSESQVSESKVSGAEISEADISEVDVSGADVSAIVSLIFLSFWKILSFFAIGSPFGFIFFDLPFAEPIFCFFSFIF